MLDASLPAPHFFKRNDDGSLLSALSDMTVPVPDLLIESDEDTDDGL